MQAIQINHKSLATRCDICHQLDCFDPITEYCERCAIYQKKIIPNNIKTNNSQYSVNQEIKQINNNKVFIHIFKTIVRTF